VPRHRPAVAWCLRHARHEQLPDGSRVYLRALRATDIAHASEFFAKLSEQSRYTRFMAPMPSLRPETIRLLTKQAREARSVVIVAVVSHPSGDEVVGGGRLLAMANPAVCEFALTIVDAWQGRGIGTVLLRALIRAAQRLGYHRIEGWVLVTNGKMLALARRARLRPRPVRADPQVVMVSRVLFPGSSSSPSFLHR
jgi:acetyltransferase